MPSETSLPPVISGVVPAPAAISAAAPSSPQHEPRSPGTNPRGDRSPNTIRRVVGNPAQQPTPYDNRDAVEVEGAESKKEERLAAEKSQFNGTPTGKLNKVLDEFRSYLSDKAAYLNQSAEGENGVHYGQGNNAEPAQNASNAQPKVVASNVSCKAKPETVGGEASLEKNFVAAGGQSTIGEASTMGGGSSSAESKESCKSFNIEELLKELNQSVGSTTEKQALNDEELKDYATQLAFFLGEEEGSISGSIDQSTTEFSTRRDTRRDDSFCDGLLNVHDLEWVIREIATEQSELEDCFGRLDELLNKAEKRLEVKK